MSEKRKGFIRKIKGKSRTGRGAGDEGTAKTFLNEFLCEQWQETKDAYDEWDAEDQGKFEECLGALITEDFKMDGAIVQANHLNDMSGADCLALVNKIDEFLEKIPEDKYD